MHAGYLAAITSPEMLSAVMSGIEANFTDTVFEKLPAAAALYVAFMVPVWPGMIGVRVYSAAVQPQDGMVFSMSSGLSLTLVTTNVAVAGTCCLTLPSWTDSVLNRAISPTFS